MPKSSNSTNCFLGLGSNLNTPKKQLNIAIKHIGKLPQTRYIQSANWYLSKAWGVTDQNDFINTVIEIQTSLTPLALLKAIKIIEYRLMQRQVNKKWHARKIDIDILLYGRQRICRRELTIPHPLIAERIFVSEPLLQMKPYLPVSLKQQLKKNAKSLGNNSELSLVENHFQL
jgi:2-amino-4-hydroxy-6-hydroxymethyldihydropteridine diphosphokinase